MPFARISVLSPLLLASVFFGALGASSAAEANDAAAHCLQVKGWTSISYKSINQHRGRWEADEASGHGWRVRLGGDGQGVEACSCTVSLDCYPKPDSPRPSLPEGVAWKYDLGGGNKFLAGSNRGEFGGEVWASTEGSGERRILATETAALIFKIEPTVYVVLGWAHLNMSEGDVYRLTVTPDNRPDKLEFRATFGEMPIVSIQHKDCEYLVGNTRIGQFCSSGVLRILAGPSPNRRRPDMRSIEGFPSIVPGPINAVMGGDGFLYIGASGGVVRVNPSSHQPSLEWLVPVSN
jgi:hypothetical protein